MLTSLKHVVLLATMCSMSAIAGQDAELAKTGQYSCWDSGGNLIACSGTGQDGDIQAGAAAKYIDKGDGTITDKVTGLTWEKKSNDGTIHDFLKMYTWDEAFAIHIATLNLQRFAGFSDWRLPNVRELASLVNYQGASPAVFPEFNSPNCLNGSGVLVTIYTGNCTAGGGAMYWTSTTELLGVTSAWVVSQEEGKTVTGPKSWSLFVRAVRGGTTR